ncbi:MAG: hypothetical protein ACK448_00915 [Bacteroidota bacterium]|jgi:hypothetical protein
MKIKFNHIKDLNDARYASSALSEWVGFSLNELPLSKVQEIIGWCAGPKLALELTEEPMLETAISWCTILPVNTLECTADSFDFWQQKIPNANQYEWIIASKNLTDLRSLQSQNHPSACYHYLPDSLNQITEECKEQSLFPNLIVNISKFQSNPAAIANLSLQAISIDCLPETTLGEKNFENTTELFEILDIF